MFPGIFSLYPTNEPVEVLQGYPTATVITMDTLRPVCNFVKAAQPIPFTVTILGVQKEVELWEYQLIEHVQDLVSPGTIFEDQARLGNVMTCSDGSATTTSGTFGFIIATNNGRRIASAHGPAPGAYPNSFRSEAYGVLATMRWLRYTLQSLPVDKQVKITHYLDNNSVVSRIKTMTKHYPNVPPNLTLLSENDVILEIISTLQQLPVTVEFHWVKGHQDATRAYETLQLPGQLNCDADRAASQYVWQEHANPQVVPPLPNTPSQLHIQGKSITGHIKQRIRDQSTVPALQQYLMKKFQWSEDTFECIDWTSYVT
jgi:hypothetical protein